MSFDAKTQAILSFLQAQAAAAPELAGEYAQMEDLYKRKLWHQLTCVLEAFMVLPAAASHLVPLFETFVKDFKHKLNKMALARIQIAMAHQMKDVDEVTAFCQAAAEDAAKEEAQASSFILSELARIQLAAERVEACKTQLDKAAEYMEAAGASNAVQAAFYRAWVAYYKVKGPAHEFYSHALLLLAYQPLSQMPREEQVTLSFDMGIAALVGENLYNFGELLEHPVVGVLQETEFAWLAHLLRAFNAGDIAQYEVLVAAHHTQLEAQPALLQNTNFLKEKITLMCLTETLFQRIGPAADRSVSFDDIAVANKLPRNQVELLLMRALSLQLIRGKPARSKCLAWLAAATHRTRGKIDEIDGTCTVEWVLPRVLAKEQIQMMHDRLKTWCSTVDGTLGFLEGETPELAAA